MTQHNNTTQDATRIIRDISEHDVLSEYYETCGEQIYNQNIYFIQTMTSADMRKITRQLINLECASTSMSEGDSFRRLLKDIEWERSFGGLSHLRA